MSKEITIHLVNSTEKYLNNFITKCELLITKNTKTPKDRGGYYEPISYEMTCEKMIDVLINQFEAGVNNQAYIELIENLTCENYEKQEGGLNDL